MTNSFLCHIGPVRHRNPLVGKIPIDINKVLQLTSTAAPASNHLSLHEISALSPDALSFILCPKCGEQILNVLKEQVNLFGHKTTGFKSSFISIYDVVEYSYYG